MTFWARARRFLTAASSELRARGRLLAAAFGPSRPQAVAPAENSANRPAADVDLISTLNQVGIDAGVHTFDWDITAGAFRFNRETMSKYGVEAAAARADLGTLIDTSIVPEDRQRFRQELGQALKGERPLCVNYRATQLDGSARAVQLRGVVFRGADGRATRVIGFTIDQTPQQQANAQIASDAEKHRQLFERLSLATEAAGIGVWDWDLVSGQLGTDSNMSSIFTDANFDGVTRGDEFVRRILHPEDRERFLSTMRGVIADGGGDRVSINFRYMRSDGGVHHVELHGRTIRNEQGRAVRLLCVSWNITAKVEAQLELERRSEMQKVLLDRLNLATEVASLDVWDWDLVHDRIVADTVNKDLAGGSHFDEMGARAFVTSFLHPEDVPNYFATLDRAIASGSTFFNRSRILGRDGKHRHVQSNARLFRDESGKAIRMLGVSQDVSEEMEHLEELRRQADEERALRDRSNLATRTAGIAIWDKDMVRGDFTCDDQFWKMFGLAPNSRFRVNEGIHPESREKALEPLEAAFADPTRDEILSVRHRTSNPRREPQYVQTHMRVFRNPDGKVARLLGVTWDVTAEELRTEELARQAAKERAMVERLNVTARAAGISPWEFDLKTNDLSWLDVVPEAYGFGNIATKDFMKALEGIIFDEDRHLLTTAAADAIAKGQQDYTYTFRVRGVGGKVYYMRNVCRVMKNERGKYRYVMGVTFDVTKEVEWNALLEQGNEEKRKLIERLGFAIDSANIGFWEMDLVGNRFLWVENPVKSLGIAPEDFGSLSLAEFETHVVPEDRNLMPDHIRAALKDPTQRFGFRYRAVAPDRSIIHVQTYGRVFTDDQGRPVRALGTSWDATKEVEVQEQLQKQAKTERALVNRLNVATQAAGISPWEYDLIGDCFSWIGAPLEVLGLDTTKPEEYLEEVSRIVVAEDRPLLRQATLDALEKNLDVYSYVYRARGIDGKIHHLKNFARVLRSSRGTPYRLVGVTWDVTEEVTANQQLKQQAEHERQLIARLNIATDSAGISSWEIDLKTNTFRWIENPIKALWRDGDMTSPERSASNMFVERMHPDDTKVMDRAIRAALKQKSDRINYRYRGFAPDGATVHVQSFARLFLDERGNVVNILGVSWDVTEEVEANLRLKQQAEHERQLTARLNIATDSAGISSWELDMKSGKFLWIENPLKAVYYEGDDGRMDAAYFTERMFPEDRLLMRDAIAAALKEKSDRIQFRYRAIGNDGSTVWVQSFARLLFDDSNRIARVLGVSMDVSAEVHTTEQLQKQAQYERDMLERLHVATQGAGMSLWEYDLKTSKHSWLSKRLSILGLDHTTSDDYYDELRKITHPDDAHLINDVPRREIAAGAENYSLRFRITGIDGKEHYLQNFVRIMRSARGTAFRLVGVTWDATEEVTTAARLAEQAQKERALTERLSIATQSAGISTWEIDLVNARFLWVENPITAASAARGGNKDLSHFSERMHPDDRKIMSTEIKKAAKENRDVIRYTYRIYNSPGELSYIQTYAKLYFNEDRRAIRALGVSWDSTKEVEAAAKLANAERRLERASLSSSEGHWEAELATGHLWCSSSFHTLLGYKTGELEQRTAAFESLIHIEDWNVYDIALKSHLANNTPYDVELRLRMSNGEYRWFHMRGAADREKDGKPTVMAGSIHDVHQQKLVEDALKLAQLRFERAINGTQDGLWELDVASGEAWCSPRLALLLGYPAAELGTKNFLSSLIHHEDAPKLENVTMAHYRDNSPFDLEVRLRTRGGDYRWYRARASADRDKNGRALRLSGSLQDVTEARAAREELLRATEAAEAANRAKSAFLANMSHEIRTPMNGIVGMTGLLLETELNRTQREYADTIRGSADSLLTVINDILDFSKIEAGKLDMENIDVDLRALVEDVASMMAFHAANKGLELIVNVHPEAPDRIKGDPQRLRQCLVNLVGNAVKFTQKGEIAIDVCALGRHEGRVLTHFEVRDTGIGIPQATLKTLFQPFVQADSSTTRHFGGTGLGLSIVRRLVEMMGGQVGVVSELGNGSNFFFTLSLEPVEFEATANAPAAKNDGRILIVDDNETNRRVLRLQLEHNGYRIITAASGADALKELHAAIERDQPIDMTITDYQMPDMDGAMLAARIAADPKLINTRLIMLTSLDKQGDTQRLAALGFAAYLTKPIRRDELLTCVKRVFDGEARQWQMEVRPMITRNTLAQLDAQKRFSGRVLLVEDNEVNQKVAGRVLERMGCTVRVAEHGQAGVDAFADEKFDLVLMDLQMPVMDGMAAARRIREIEKADASRGRTPIVALTANAMKGDRELCEAAGMDDYLTKPLEVERLRATLSRFGMMNRIAEPDLLSSQPLAAPEAGPATTPIDLARLNRLVDGDMDFMHELLTTFVTSGEQQIVDLENAAKSFDRVALARCAHKLKGGCGNIHAIAMRDLASAIEDSAGTGAMSELTDLCGRLRKEFERAKKFLSDPSVMPTPIRAAS